MERENRCRDLDQYKASFPRIISQLLQQLRKTERIRYIFYYATSTNFVFTIPTFPSVLSKKQTSEEDARRGESGNAASFGSFDLRFLHFPQRHCRWGCALAYFLNHLYRLISTRTCFLLNFNPASPITIILRLASDDLPQKIV